MPPRLKRRDPPHTGCWSVETGRYHWRTTGGVCRSGKSWVLLIFCSFKSLWWEFPPCLIFSACDVPYVSDFPMQEATSVSWLHVPAWCQIKTECKDLQLSSTRIWDGKQKAVKVKEEHFVINLFSFQQGTKRTGYKKKSILKKHVFLEVPVKMGRGSSVCQKLPVNTETISK